MAEAGIRDTGGPSCSPKPNELPSSFSARCRTPAHERSAELNSLVYWADSYDAVLCYRTVVEIDILADPDRLGRLDLSAIGR